MLIAGETSGDMLAAELAHRTACLKLPNQTLD